MKDVRQKPIKSGFRFDKLQITGVDNTSTIARLGSAMSAQETALFHDSVSSGDEYVDQLHRRLESSLELQTALPVVRFADGEYAFYAGSLKCNGLYRQAESVEAINSALPKHIEALRYVAQKGIVAPLVFPGNCSNPDRAWRSFFRRSKSDDAAIKFLAFLSSNGVELNATNYVPFYVVYAYLTSVKFAKLVDGRKVCILNSDIRGDVCAQWFEKQTSSPEIAEVNIPSEFIATRWASMERDVLDKIPRDTELCLIGAGIGALSVCASVARYLSIPAIDGGHVLNMMNDLEAKSAGPRLYTVHQKR